MFAGINITLIRAINTMSDTIEAQVMPEQQSVAVRKAGEVASALPADQIKPPVTAAQAKVEAVANLTMKAYERAATLKLTPEESAALQADFPDSAFLPGAAGKEHLIYIEHAHLRDRFNQVFGLGQWAIVPRNRWAEEFQTGKGTPGSRVYVEAMLVVRGCFVAEAVGAMEYYPKNESQNYGDAVEGAKTAALRRCAKELGVGLQAWKKEWCEGWWARKRGGRDFSKKPPSSTTPPPKNPPAAAQTQKKGTVATAAYRTKMIQNLKAAKGEGNRRIVTEYFQKVGPPHPLMPTEELEELPLRFVPINEDEMKALEKRLAEFEAGEPAVLPFEPHWEGGVPPTTAAPTTDKPPHDDEWWREIIVPVPPKGVKRDTYMKHPQTIGMLYELRHGNDEEAKAARQRLWGFVNHYEAKGWTKTNGQEMPPSDADIKFREALTAFNEWFTNNHPGEKL